jgi:hypothetical protein
MSAELDRIGRAIELVVDEAEHIEGRSSHDPRVRDRLLRRATMLRAIASILEAVDTESAVRP